MECSPRDRKDAARGPEEQESYNTLINTSSRRVRRDGKNSYGVYWFKKVIWYGSAKLDNWLSKNVQDIRQSHKVYRKYRGKLESWTDSSRKKLNWAESPERNLPWPFVIARMPLRKCTGWYKLHKSQEKMNYLMYMDGMKLFAKNEKELEMVVRI